MAVNSLSGIAQYNIALEALRQSARQDQVAAAALTQVQQAPERSGLDSAAGGRAPSGNATRGTLVDLIA